MKEKCDAAMTGKKGEKEVVKRVPCPNCGAKLRLLPRNYPLADVVCTACAFRAQVKTNNCKPKNEIFGAGWNILNCVLRSGYLPPPLIVNFRWEKKRLILFFPFVPKSHIRKTKVKQADGKVLKMFNYIGLDKLPRIQLYPEIEERSIPLYTKTKPEK
jgi:hypothetical protein